MRRFAWKEAECRLFLGRFLLAFCLRANELSLKSGSWMSECGFVFGRLSYAGRDGMKRTKWWISVMKMMVYLAIMGLRDGLAAMDETVEFGLLDSALGMTTTYSAWRV